MNDTENQESEIPDNPDEAELAAANGEPVSTQAEDSNLEQEVDGDSPAESPDPVHDLVLAQAEIVKLKDSFLRAKAEQDNIRRRSEKEVANSRKFAVEGFAKELLNVRDSLSLACSIELDSDADEAVKSIREGVEITLKQLDSVFAKFALVEVAPEVGDKLDPNIHQAMSMVESDEVASGHILNVIQAGFSLHERLLRPAMVVVAK